MVLELPQHFFQRARKLAQYHTPDSYRPLSQVETSSFSRPLYHALSSKVSRLDGLSSPHAQALGDAKRVLAETSVQAVAMVTAEARAMAAAMAAVNAMAIAATTAVAAAIATASDSCVEGICVVDAAAGAMTMALMTAVKVAAR